MRIRFGCGLDSRIYGISLYSINWLVFITDGVFTARYVLHSAFCPHTVFMCFVWIWEQTAIISLYSINWLVGFYNWDGVCLLRGMDGVFIIQINSRMYSV